MYRPAVIGAVQSLLIPISVDNAIHISEDRSTAMIRVTPDVVFHFEDDAQGICETVSVLKQVGNRSSNDGMTPKTDKRS